jgi:hypothetical protein
MLLLVMSTKISSKRKIPPANRRTAAKHGATNGLNGSIQGLKSRTPLQELLDSITESWSRIPQEERDRIPADGAMNIDHYLYGTPKVTE